MKIDKQLKQEAIEYQKKRGIVNLVFGISEIGIGITLMICSIQPQLGASVFYVGLVNTGLAVGDLGATSRGVINPNPTGPIPGWFVYFDSMDNPAVQYSNIFQPGRWW